MKPVFPAAEESRRPVNPSAGAAADLSRRWRTGEPCLEDFLADRTAAGLDGSPSARELGELVSIDQRERWRRGERPQAEDYLARFPQLSSDTEVALDVIYNEFLISETLGEVPSKLDYEQRFPRYAKTLRDQIEFHLALGVEAAASQSGQDTRRTPSAAQQTTVAGTRLPAHLTNIVPGYEILSELGRGGMGVVYQARQLSLNRLVALKMLRAGDCGSTPLLARFRAEAEAVARLHHPQIVQIYDYGEHDGMPYLALELVEGGSLAAKIQGTPWPAREAAELIVTLSRAVQFAHEQGIVHRDLKPANVLVRATEKSGTVGTVVAKITDFGLAKVFRETAESNTQTGAILGTPSYMAPEQARGQSHLIGPAVDVYALGAILYELLTGQPPFKAATAMETLNQLLTADPVSPTRLVPRLPRDLITIVTKCLQKEPQQRYGSASELADDLDRFLRDRPILARRTSMTERGWRWCRRNPVVSLLAGSVAGLLLAVAAVSFIDSILLRSQLTKTQQAEQGESASRSMAEIRLWDSYLAEINASHGSQKIGQRAESLATVDRANELLNSIGRTPERVLQLRNATIATLARPDLQQVRVLAPSPGIVSVDFSITSDRYVTGSLGALNLYQLSTGQHLHTISSGDLYGVGAISADGRFVSATTDNGTTVWRCDGAKPVQVWSGQGENFVSFSLDSRQAAVSDSSGMRLIELPSGKTAGQLGKGSAQSQFAFHAPSRRIAVCTPTSLQIIDWDTGQILTELLSEVGANHGAGVAWHPSGELVVVGGLNDGVELWDVAAKRRHMTFPHRGPITAPRFSRNGNLLLTFNPWTTSLRVWNVGTGQEVLRAPTFGNFAMDASATDGDQLINIGAEGVALCRLEPGLAANPYCLATDATLGEVQNVAVSPDGRLLAIGRRYGFELWDLVTQRRASHTGSPFCGLKFDSRGDLFTASQWGLYQWPRQVIATPATTEATSTSSGTATLRFGPPKKLSGQLDENAISISDDGKVIAVKAASGWQVIHPESPGSIIQLDVDMDPRWVSVSPDGRVVALSNWNKSGTIVCNSATGKRVELPSGRTGQPHFSPDGKWLATSSDGVCLWRVDDWKLTTQFHAHGTTPSGLGIAFSSDSKVLALGQPHGITRLVDPVSGANWAEWVRPDLSDSAYMAFTPDRSRLIEVPAGDRGAPRIWNIAGIREELARRGLDWPADILKVLPPAKDSTADMVVTLAEGKLRNLQAVTDLIKEAGHAKDAKARDLLERALKLNPDSAAAHNTLSWTLATGEESLRDPPAAVRHARRAVELDGSLATYRNTLGVALYRNGQYQEAIKNLEESLQRSGESAAAYDLIFLALCHARLGNAKDAAACHERAASWLEKHRSTISPVWLEELTAFFAEAKITELPFGN